MTTKRKAVRRILALLLALYFLPLCARAEEPRLPGPAEFTDAERASILANGTIERSPWLDAALSLLEEGNPFLARYNLLTGADVRAILPFGVPYLYGGRAANHVFSRVPDYAVERAWTSSPLYYVSGRQYLTGFDCVGFVRWVWEQVRADAWPSCDVLLRDRARHVLNMDSLMPDWESLAQLLQPGDILVLRHPDNHVALYAGTLRMYGYTAEEVPALAAYLDYPLVIHSTTNAAVADRFAWLLRNGLPKYRAATVTDGGVCVSLLGAPREQARHVFQQNQSTWYFVLPDNTWLSLFGWSHVTDYAWWRPPDSSEIAFPARPPE